MIKKLKCLIGRHSISTVYCGKFSKFKICKVCGKPFTDDVELLIEAAADLFTPINILEHLANYKHEEVKKEVILNPNTPYWVIHKLAKAANALEDITTMRAAYMVARSLRSSPPEFLSIVSKNQLEQIRHYVARNSNTPIEILRQLSKDNNVEVRLGITYNPNTPIEVLEMLTQSINPYVQYVAINKLKERTKV